MFGARTNFETPLNCFEKSFSPSRVSPLSVLLKGEGRGGTLRGRGGERRAPYLAISDRTASHMFFCSFLEAISKHTRVLHGFAPVLHRSLRELQTVFFSETVGKTQRTNCQKRPPKTPSFFAYFTFRRQRYTTTFTKK